MKKGKREHRAFARGYEVKESTEKLTIEPPMRDLYCEWMNGCDRYNRKFYEVRGPAVRGWKCKFVTCFLIMCLINSHVLYSSMCTLETISIEDFIVKLSQQLME